MKKRRAPPPLDDPSWQMQRDEPKFWPLDPLYDTPVVLLAQHLNALPQAELARSGEVCWLYNHPIRYVKVGGLVIGVDPKHPHASDTRVSVTLDDGTGLIECVHWKGESDTDDAWRHTISIYKHARYVQVHGKLGRFRQARQLVVQHAWAIDDPQAESLHWLEAATLWNECYQDKFRRPGLVQKLEQQQQPQPPPQPPQPPSYAPAGPRPVVAGAGSPSAPPASEELQALVLQAMRAPGAERRALSASEIHKELPRGPAKLAFKLADVKDALRALDEASRVYVAQEGRDPLYRCV
jgi:hypothetical protein